MLFIVSCGLVAFGISVFTAFAVMIAREIMQCIDERE